MNVEKTLPTFGVSFAKPFPAPNRIFLTFKNCRILILLHFCICQYDKYSSKMFPLMYMGVEVMICKSERYPERLMIYQTPSIGGIKLPQMGEGCGGNSPSFWGEFCMTLSTQNRIFLTFQNCQSFKLLHFCICQYDKYSSKKLYSTVHNRPSSQLHPVYNIPSLVVKIMSSVL